MVGELSIPGSGARLCLFVRSSTPTAARERQSVAVERLRALADGDDRIEDVAVRSWAKRIPVDGRDREATHAVYAAFSTWAREHDVELSPFFETRECHSTITGCSHTALVLPVLCLAVYEGDRLSAVFPHIDGTRAVAVGDALDAFETDTERTPVSTVGAQ